MAVQAQMVVTPALQWANGITGDGILADVRYLKIDASQNVITAGTFNGIVDFNPGQGVFNLSSTPLIPGYLSSYVSKCDSAGNFLWAKKIGINSMSPFASGDVQVQTLAVDKGNGDIYITGMFGDTVDFDPGAGLYILTPEFNNDDSVFYTQTFILKLDQSGNFKWAKKMDYGISINSSAIGNNTTEEHQIYFSGSSSGALALDYDPSSGTTFYLLALDIMDCMATCFALMNLAILFLQKKIAEGETLLNYGTGSIVPDSEGNLYINGFFNGTADVDPDFGTTLLSSADTINGSHDPYAAIELFLCKYTCATKRPMGKRCKGKEILRC